MKKQDEIKYTIRQGLLSLVFSYIFAFLFVYFYRYPAPLIGNIGPYGKYPTNSFLDALNSSSSSFLFYILAYGGFVLVPMVTFALNVVFKNDNDNAEKNWLGRLAALISAFCWSLWLAI